MPQEPDQKLAATGDAQVSQGREGGSSHASPIDLSPGDCPRVVIVDGKEIYIPQKWEENLPPRDYSDVPPEHDGRPFYTKPAGWQPAPSSPLPNLEGASQADYEAAIRQHLLPQEKF
jgi:hypothetical protein